METSEAACAARVAKAVRKWKPVERPRSRRVSAALGFRRLWDENPRWAPVGTVSYQREGLAAVDSNEQQLTAAVCAACSVVYHPLCDG